MPTKQEYILGLADRRFRESYRELLAHFPNADESLIAYVQLNYADQLSSNLELRAYTQILESALVSLIDNEALVPVAPPNSSAQADLAKLRLATGVGLDQLPPPPPKPLSPQQQLEGRVISDWNSLKVADFRRNCANDKAYRETFERLSVENRLGGNTATSLQRAGA